MAPPRKLPDAATLASLRDKGMRIKDIAERYDVTEAAVWRALTKAGLVPQRKSTRDILPWKIERKHAGAQIMTHFRMIVRQINGEEIPPSDLRRLTEWLTALDEDGVSVAYHPDAPPNQASSTGGFYYVAREDRDVNRIRVPEEVASPEEEPWLERV